MNETHVVVYGPPLVGKGTLLETVNRVAGGAMRSVEIPDEESANAVRSHKGIALRVEFCKEFLDMVTIPGGVWGLGPWRHLLTTADVMVLALDLQPQRVEANRRCIEAAIADLPVPSRGCILFTKVDLVPSNHVDAAVANLTSLWKEYGFDWPAFIFRRSDGTAVHRLLRAVCE
jgi:hypothetical protein